MIEILRRLFSSMSGTLPVVVDIGSGFFKAGFAGEFAPALCYPCIVSDGDLQPIGEGGKRRKQCTGFDALRNARSPSEVRYPAAYGVVKDWDSMEFILANALENELKVDTKDTTIMLTESPFNPPEAREAASGLIFEQLRCEAMYFAADPVLSLYASGRWTGLVIDCGDGTTHISPVYESSCYSQATARMDFGGRDLTMYLCSQFLKNNRKFSFEIQTDVFRIIKETFCYVAQDFAMELEGSSFGKEVQRNYELPDGQTVSLKSESFKCPELFFQPHLADFDYEGIHEVSQRVISNCPSEIRRELYENILLVGGSSEFVGFSGRLEKEMLNFSASAKLLVPDNRKFASWHGGSLLASLSSFQNRWITRNEYEECGPQVFKDKCILSTANYLQPRN